jgi:nitronate monooxygenase
MNTLLSRLGISLPIIQAPMAGVSTPEMAAAVSNAGGLGSIGIGNVDAETARTMIRRVRAISDRPFNVNVFCHRPAVADGPTEAGWIRYLEPEFRRVGARPPERLTEIYRSFLVDDRAAAMLVEERPAVVSFHFGLPSAEVIGELRRAGSVLLASATNPAEARSAYEAGVDAVVAQGYEAGGHRGLFDPRAVDDRLGTTALVRLLAKQAPIPIIAAGGVMDGAGIGACLALGAAAAQLGTAYVLCPESSADAGYRAALRSEAAHHTVMTAAISGRPARGLPNRITALGESPDAPRVPAYPIAYDAAKALHAHAKAAGEFGYGAQWAGQGAPLARALAAAELTAVLAAELRASGK